MFKQKLIISDNEREVYHGEGSLDDWRDRLGGNPTKDRYALCEMTRRTGSDGCDTLTIKSRIENRVRDEYEPSVTCNVAILLNPENEALILDILDAQKKEQGR